MATDKILRLLKTEIFVSEISSEFRENWNLVDERAATLRRLILSQKEAVDAAIRGLMFQFATLKLEGKDTKKVRAEIVEKERRADGLTQCLWHLRRKQWGDCAVCHKPLSVERLQRDLFVARCQECEEGRYPVTQRLEMPASWHEKVGVVGKK